MTPQEFVPRPEDLQRIKFDKELEKVLLIAAKVGEKSGDQTFCSYSSIVIAFLWSDDRTSLWFQKFVKEHNVNPELIYRHRGVGTDIRDEVLEVIKEGYAPSRPVSDVFSRSAHTMLRNAVAVAKEAGLTEGPVGTRHLMAAYVFRNPTSHDNDLKQWGINVEILRRQFAGLIVDDHAPEIESWKETLKGYFHEHIPETEENHPGKILSSYRFEKDALEIIRLVEVQAAKRTPSILISELLIFILVEAGPQALSISADCKYLYESVNKDKRTSSKFRSFFKGIEVDSRLESVEDFGPDGTSLDVSRGLKRILDRARTNAFATTRREIVGVRHMIASILVVDDSTAHSWLVEAGVSLSALRQVLLGQFIREWTNDDGGEWRLVLIGTTPPTMTGFDSDQATGDDRLDVTRFATALATVISANQVTPPISIGIFGDWGSGKSFFMHLMQEQTKRVCNYTDVDEHGERLFCRRVVPIVFNAWHYSETNLWASLAQTILEALTNAIVGDNADKIFDELVLAKELREEAERALNIANEKQGDAQAEFDRIKDDVTDKQRAIDSIETRDFMTALKSEILDEDDINKTLEEAEEFLGIDGAKHVIKNVGAIMEVINDSKVDAARARSTWNWLLQTTIFRKLFFVGLPVVMLLSLLGWYLWDILPDARDKITALVVEAGVIIGTLSARARPLLSRV